MNIPCLLHEIKRSTEDISTVMSSARKKSLAAGADITVEGVEVLEALGRIANAAEEIAKQYAYEREARRRREP